MDVLVFPLQALPQLLVPPGDDGGLHPGQGVELLVEPVLPGQQAQAAAHDEQAPPRAVPLVGGGLEPGLHRNAGGHDDGRVHALPGQPLPQLGGAHQVAVGAAVDPLAVDGQVGDAGDQGHRRAGLLLPAGDQLGAEGMGGHRHVGPLLLQQLLQPVQEVPLKGRVAVALHVFRHLIVSIINPAAMGDQQGKALVPRLRGAGHGVINKVQHFDLRAGLLVLELLRQRLGGRPVAHAEFSCENQDFHVQPSCRCMLSLFVPMSIAAESLENPAPKLKESLRK